MSSTFTYTHVLVKNDASAWKIRVYMDGETHGPLYLREEWSRNLAATWELEKDRRITRGGLVTTDWSLYRLCEVCLEEPATSGYSDRAPRCSRCWTEEMVSRG